MFLTFQIFQMIAVVLVHDRVHVSQKQIMTAEFGLFTRVSRSWVTCRFSSVLLAVYQRSDRPTVPPLGVWFLALLWRYHLPVIMILFRAAETRTLSVELYRAIRFVYFHHGPTHGRETTKAMGTIVGM